MKPLLVALFFFQAADVPLVQPKDLAAHLDAKPAIFLRLAPTSYTAASTSRARFTPALDPSPKASTMLKSGRRQPAARPAKSLIYCGCCPWDRCPNVKPAIEALKQMGFTKVKVLYLETNFASDWIAKDYPVEH